MENSTTTNLEDFLRKANFDLSLAAGFFGFYAHLGFIKALEYKKLVPQKIFGSSAGAIVGAFWANGVDTIELEKLFLNIKRADFWDPTLGLGLLRGNKYQSLLSEYLPQSFKNLKIPLEIAIYDIFAFRSRIIKQGDLRLAIRASSAFPGLFQPVKIENKYYIDGGLGDELGLGERDSRDTLLIHSFYKRPKLKASELKLKQQIGPSVLLNLKNLPASGPHLMHLGKEIIDRAYVQTLELLESPVTSHQFSNASK